MYHLLSFTLTEKLDGYYALSGGVEIPEGADLYADKYKVPGSYYCQTDGRSRTLVNLPKGVSYAFTLKVDYSTGKGYPRQTFHVWVENKIISRIWNPERKYWEYEKTLATESYVDSFLQTQIIVNTEQLIVCKSGNIFTACLNGLQNSNESTLGLEEKYRPSYAARSILMENDSGHPVVAYFNAVKIFLAYDRINNSFVPASDRLYGQITWMI